MNPREIRSGVRRVFGLALRRPGASVPGADAELESMITEHVEHLVARGADPAAARAEALRALGDSTLGARSGVRSSAAHRERTLWWREAVREFFADARYGIRTLRRSPSFSIAAILTLALAIGANTAIFSAVSAVILRPLRYAAPDRLVSLYETNPDFGWTEAEVAPANYLDWREQVSSFEDVAAWNNFNGAATLTGYGEPRLLNAVSVTGNLFSVLGVRAVIGRTLDSTETWRSGAQFPVVLSYRVWRDVFGGDSGIVNRSIVLNGRSLSVAGVVPESFTIPGLDSDIYSSVNWPREDRAAVFFRRAHFVRPVARLKPGATREQADAELQTVVTRLQSQYPETNTHMGAGFKPLHDFLVGNTREPLLVMFAAVGVLLLIACANIANLLLVRAAGRQREAALRLALGAGRGRLARQAFTESAVLALAGGLAGIALGWWGTRVFVALQPPGLIPVRDIAMSWTVLGYVSAVTAVSAVAFGVAPALWMTRRVPADVLKDDGRSTTGSVRARRWGELLLVGEVALSVTLALGAGLLVRSYSELRLVHPGFESAGVLAATINLPGTRYDSAFKVEQFFNGLEQRTAALPGVVATASVSQLPLTTPAWSSQFSVLARNAPPSTEQVRHREVTPRYHEVMRVPLRSGRLLASTDGVGSRNVVLINEAFARKHFPDENPIGLTISFDRVPDATSVWRTIVGVVGDERLGTMAVAPVPEFFEPLAQEPRQGMTLVVRTSGDPAALTPALRRIVAELDPALAIVSVRTMESVRSAALARDRFLTTLMLAFAGVGVALGIVGVYGVVAQLVRRRRREMGIRVALGAGARQVQWLIVRHGLVLTLTGVVVGVGAALALTGALRTLLYEVTPADPMTFALVPLLVVASALAASWIPALRASRTAPTEVLRAD
ncbi:MAG: ABC transporter permease [Gemmatimonadetes bacterium]|nr:ABC transporter permease [Gemmatimonadota bacterium]